LVGEIVHHRSVYWQSFQEKIPVSPREQPVSGNWWTGSSSTATVDAQNWGKISPINFELESK